jgi:hypothetical protein
MRILRVCGWLVGVVKGFWEDIVDGGGGDV